MYVEIKIFYRNIFLKLGAVLKLCIFKIFLCI